MNGEKMQEKKHPANNFWYFLSADCDVAVVFVHGLNSDSERCWRADNGVFWPDILKADKTFARAAIYLGGYYTGIDSGEYDIAQCSDELFRALEFAYGEDHAPLDFRNICFVCHSLGGIVVRRMIEAHSSVFKEKRLGLVLMASPTMGADYGRFLTAIAKLYDHQVGIALKAGGRELKDIDDRFRRLIDDKHIPNFYGAEAAEHMSLLAPKLLPRLVKPIVGTDSASRYFGNLKIIPGTNHISIVKPDGVEHDSHRFLSHFFKIRYLPNAIALQKPLAVTISPRSPALPEAGPSVARVLFDIYESSCSPYYLIRDVDEEFVKKLELSTVWITGPSASGKTSMVRRFLRDEGRAPVEVTLSHCGSHPSEEYCLAEILDTASKDRFDGKITTTRSFGELVDVLSSKGRESNIVLFIDEVPVDSVDLSLLEPFVRFLSDLLDSIKKRVGPDVRFVICSIERPRIHQRYAKLLGQLNFVHLLPWNPHEIERLFDLIRKFLPQLSVDRRVAEQAILESDGSPRFLKKFIGQLMLTHEAEASEQKRILAETVEHFKATF